MPTPLAVPWTPPAQGTAPAQTHGVEAHATQAPAHQPHQAAPIPPHAPMRQPALQMPQHAVQAQPVQGFQPQSHMPPAQTYPSAAQQNPGHMTPQPGFQPPQNQQPHAQHPHGQFQPPQMATPGYPPMPQPTAAVVQEKPESKSLLAGLLKREPKAATAEGQAASATSRSLFDKNFIFGLAAGLILGFLVLPMVFGGSSEPAYSPVAETAVAPVAELELMEDESFVDAALAEDVP